MVRRIPDLNPDLNPGRNDGQETLFATWRFHAFFTTIDHHVADTVAAAKTHRGHAIIEQVHADLKNSALEHLPSAKFTADAAWLVLAVMAFNLTRAAATSDGAHLTTPKTGPAESKWNHLARGQSTTHATTPARTHQHRTPSRTTHRWIEA